MSLDGDTGLVSPTATDRSGFGVTSDVEARGVSSLTESLAGKPTFRGVGLAYAAGGMGVESAADRKGCNFGLRMRFARGFMWTYDSVPLDSEFDASSWAGSGGAFACTTRTGGADGGAAGRAVSAESTRVMVARGDVGAEYDENGAGGRDRVVLRGMWGRGAPALLECRE